jgi:hypothetical protein
MRPANARELVVSAGRNDAGSALRLPAAMGREHLPPDFSGPLDFDGLADMLRHLEGEEVSVVVESAHVPGTPGTRVEMSGALRRLTGHALAETECFAVEQSPGLRLPRGHFLSATLSTIEGTSYFVIAVRMRGMDLVIGQPDLVGE